MKVFSVLLVLVFAATASAGLVEDFESYADTAAMQAAWGAAGAGTLDGAVGNPGQSMYHPGGTQNTRMLDTALTEATGQPIVWEFDMLEESVADLGNNRVTCALDKATWGWFEFGLYNDLVDPDDLAGPHVDGYGMRILGNGGEGWMSFPGDPTSRTGWHHFKATIEASQTVFEVWLSAGLTAGGNPIDAEYHSFTSAHDGTGLTWDEIKIGGPSNYSSTSGVYFDNVSVAQVPEPATLTLLAFGAVALIRRRR